MSTIREVVRALSEREGVDAVLLLGRDGLPIDSVCGELVDADNVAALVPTVVGAVDKVGDASARGTFHTGVVESSDGFMILTAVTAEILLALFVQPNTNVGPLLYELRRYQDAMSAIL